MDGLHLPPRRPPPPGLVGRAHRLHHHPLVAGGQGLGLEGEGGVEVVGRWPATARGGRRSGRGRPTARRGAGRGGRRRRGGGVEEPHAERRPSRRPGRVPAVRRPKLLIVSWNASGPSSLTPRISPSSTTWSRSRARSRSTTAGRRSVTSLRLRVKRRTSSPRRWAWMRAPSSFHSIWDGPSSARAEATSARGGGEHGQDRAEDLEADGVQARLAVGEGDGGHPGQVAGEHGRPADGRQGDARRPWPRRRP